MAEDEQQREQIADDDLSAEELIRQLKVSDLLLGTLASLVQLGYAKLGEGDLPDARLAIEALRTLTPVLEGVAGDDQLRDLRQATANLQLAYADAVVKSQAPASAPADEHEPA